MSEILNGLSNKTWFITILSFLAANLGTILTMALVIVKNQLKTKRLSALVDEKLQEKGITLNQELLDKISNIQSTLESKTDEVLSKVEAKLKIDSEEKKEAVQNNALEIQELIKATTAKITSSLDELDTENKEE